MIAPLFKKIRGRFIVLLCKNGRAVLLVALFLLSRSDAQKYQRADDEQQKYNRKDRF